MAKAPLTEKQVEALDHDKDGKAGGSVPKAREISAEELEAEALAAREQSEHGR